MAGYQPISNYGVIGNLRTTALVGMNGSIDWYCQPHFDSPSLFGAILDARKGGFFRISPISEDIHYKQLYLPDTNVLISRFSTRDGVAELEDWMPVGSKSEGPEYGYIVRNLRCIRGSLRFLLECRPAFNYGRTAHRAEIKSEGGVFSTDNSMGNEGSRMILNSEFRLQPDGQNGVRVEFPLNEGQCAYFVLRPSARAEQDAPIENEHLKELNLITTKYWRNWLSGCTYRGRWREQVHRSALALKLLTFEPTGAIVAAPTTSLPEVIGGERNWDYRYTWLRDAAFTVYAFLRIGFTQEAKDFIRWIEKYVAPHLRDGAPLPAMLQINGQPVGEEVELSHWEGYRGSGPVRIGNSAVNQIQNDIPGELLDALYLANKHGIPTSYESWRRIRNRVNQVCETWRDPDDGIWEVRGGRREFTYSRVMSWVAVDRALRLAEKRSFPAPRERWILARDEIYEEVQSKGWNPKIGAFTQSFGSDDLDASLLIMPLVFFMAPTDPRMLATLDAILKSPVGGGLVSDGLVYRYLAGQRVDGLSGEEGTFNMCSFWLVEALTRAGAQDPARLDHARLLFERMLSFANHLGLYSEQMSFEGEALGNFPQAFTHLALISAAFNLDRTLGARQ
jgi:GH15 family glucan-1,4-alpha-glucosidase